jgi:3-oxoacyl-[acyl-carrier-protein] synthase-3
MIDFDLANRGDAHNLIRVEAGGSRQPASIKTVVGGGHFFRMSGRDVTEIVLHEVPPFVDKLLAHAGVSADEVAHVVPHQANGVLLAQLVERCGLAGATTHRTVEKYGNVGSAAIPVTLDEANRASRLADGDLVLLLGFGGGISMGAALLRWAAPVGK